MINTQVKFREYWRPYSPSIRDVDARELFPEEMLSEYMALSVPVSHAWREKYPMLVNADGTTRPQVVREETSPDFYRLLTRFKEQTGTGVLINTTLSRPGEALVCSPEDAINLFLGTDLDYMIMENLLVTKRAYSETW